MPINDSAGVGVYLIDKSQRGTTTYGFRAGVAIETARGMCNTPMLVSSAKEFVSIFGSPSMDKYGLANLEAYQLSQAGVPLWISRAKSPSFTGTDKTLGCLTFTSTPVAEGADPQVIKYKQTPTNGIANPVDANTSYIFFRGEGDYCAGDSDKLTAPAPKRNKSNIVMRVCKPASESAYAKSGRYFQLQVFDFDGTEHIDSSRTGEFSMNPALPLSPDEGAGIPCTISLDPAILLPDTYAVEAYVNGVAGYSNDGTASKPEDVTSATAMELENAIISAVANAIQRELLPSWKTTDLVWDGDTGCFTIERPEINCFELSVSLVIRGRDLEVTAPTGKTLPLTGNTSRMDLSAGNATFTATGEGASKTWKANVSLNTSFVIHNAQSYMYVPVDATTGASLLPEGEDPYAYWARIYTAYLKEAFTVSFSFDDYDSGYSTMQIDTVLEASNYLQAKTYEDGTFADYVAPKPGLIYFGVNSLTPNTIDPAEKSYAYSQALQVIATDNLIKYRCVAMPNLGDAMSKADFTSVITGANETTLGISNLGRPASLNIAANYKDVRHGNPFIADYAQYGLRNISGRRVWVTMACLITRLLHANYSNGAEARPPFGYKYGQVICDALSQELSGPERKQVAEWKINPIADDNGFFAWEDCTSQIQETSLSDIHNILSFCWMKLAIYDAMKSFVAEYNDEDTVASGLNVLHELNRSFIAKKYIEEGIPDASNNVIGDKVLRFDYHIRFKGVARYVDVYVTAYPQTQELSISLGE